MAPGMRAAHNKTAGSPRTPKLLAVPQRGCSRDAAEAHLEGCSLAGDLEPENLAVCTAFGSPIGGEAVDHPETASVGLVTRERTNGGSAWSLVFDLDSYPMGIHVDRHAHAASGMNNGVGDELTDEENRQLDDRRFDTAVAQDASREDPSATDARWLASQLDSPRHPHPHERRSRS
jgi:hypothetical protein